MHASHLRDTTHREQLMRSPLRRSALALSADLAIAQLAIAQDVPDNERVLFEVPPATLDSTSGQCAIR